MKPQFGTAIVGRWARRQGVSPGRVAALVAVVATTVALATVLAGVVHAFSTGDYRTLLSHHTLTPFITAGFALVGTLVAGRSPRNPIGWLFLATACLYAASVVAVVASKTGTPGPASSAAIWLSLWAWVPAVFLPTSFIFLLFPDGRLPSPRWRPVGWLAGVGLVAVSLGLALHPGPLEAWGTPANPYGVVPLAPLLAVLIDIGTLLLLGGVVGSVVVLAKRYRRSAGEDRLQIKWVAYAAVLMLAGFVVGSILWYAAPESALAGEVGIALSNLTILAIAVAAAIAILQHRLYDIDLIINRTLVYAALSALVTGLYIALVTALGSLFAGAEGFVVPLLATGVVAVLFQPLRSRLQRGANRLLYGERDEPARVLSQLALRLEAATEPERTLPALVETVADALKLPYAALLLQEPDGPRVAADYGRHREPTFSFPVSYQGERIGELRVAARDRGTSLAPADQTLLETLARQAGAAVRSVQLTRDLRSSRKRLVELREEERRRLRRDLHDGLGPALAGITLKLEAAQNLLRQEPQAVGPLLVELRGEVQELITDLRRLIYALRPPALDELGLVPALRELVGHHERSRLQFELEAPEPLPQLPAATEVAAYRIVQEAVTNVVRHSRASSCRIAIDVGRTVRINISDDGLGLAPTLTPGVGLTSMRERVEELGGTFDVRNRSGGGVEVAASLPASVG